jgi:hypothetical protein
MKVIGLMITVTPMLIQSSHFKDVLLGVGRISGCWSGDGRAECFDSTCLLSACCVAAAKLHGLSEHLIPMLCLLARCLWRLNSLARWTLQISHVRPPSW